MDFPARTARPLLAGLAALSLGYFACECFFHIYQWNTEGLLMVDAYQLYHGLRPYRDFVTYAPPGLIYLLGAIFKVAEPRVVAARFLTVCLPKWGIALTLYHVLRRIGFSTGTGLAGGGLATLALGTTTFAGSDYAGVHPTVMCTFLAALSLWALIVWLQEGSLRVLIFAGLVTGVDALFRYDIGLYSFLACAAAIALAPSLPGSGNRRPFSALAVYAAAVAASLGPVVVYFLLKAPRANLELSFLAYPRAYLHRNTRLGLASFFPSPFTNAVLVGGSFYRRLSAWWLYDAFRTLVFVVYGWSWIHLAGRRRAGAWGRAEQGLFCAALLGLFLWGYFVKSRNVFSLSMPVFVLLPALVALNWRASSPFRRLAARVVALWAAGLAALMLACKPILPRSYHRLTDIPALRGLWIPKAEAESVSALVRAVDALVPPGGRILVCDRYFSDQTPLELYVLADRLPGTGVFDFFPGVTNRPDVERRVIADLERSQVAAVVQGGFAGATPPPEDRSPGLEAFLAGRFQPAETFGAYTLWRLKHVR